MMGRSIAVHVHAGIAASEQAERILAVLRTAGPAPVTGLLEAVVDTAGATLIVPVFLMGVLVFLIVTGRIQADARCRLERRAYAEISVANALKALAAKHEVRTEIAQPPCPVTPEEREQEDAWAAREALRHSPQQWARDLASRLDVAMPLDRPPSLLRAEQAKRDRRTQRQQEAERRVRARKQRRREQIQTAHQQAQKRKAAIRHERLIEHVRTYGGDRGWRPSWSEAGALVNDAVFKVGQKDLRLLRAFLEQRVDDRLEAPRHREQAILDDIAKIKSFEETFRNQTRSIRQVMPVSSATWQPIPDQAGCEHVMLYEGASHYGRCLHCGLHEGLKADLSPEQRYGLRKRFNQASVELEGLSATWVPDATGNVTVPEAEAMRAKELLADMEQIKAMLLA